MRYRRVLGRGHQGQEALVRRLPGGISVELPLVWEARARRRSSDLHKLHEAEPKAGSPSGNSSLPKQKRRIPCSVILGAGASSSTTSANSGSIRWVYGILRSGRIRGVSDAYVPLLASSLLVHVRITRS